jgi:hypothetical protein
MGSSHGFRLAPALVSGTGAPHGFGPTPGGPGNRSPYALALAPIYGLKTSSRPMMLPPFEIRVTHPASVVKYPSFPVTD